MTPARYEIEFQGLRRRPGSMDCLFIPLQPQALDAPPGIYAPYQPRFEWNLWFASPGCAATTAGVPRPKPGSSTTSTEACSCSSARNLFEAAAPTEVRSAASRSTGSRTAPRRRRSGRWWRRDDIGPVLPRGDADGGWSEIRERCRRRRARGSCTLAQPALAYVFLEAPARRLWIVQHGEADMGDGETAPPPRTRQGAWLRRHRHADIRAAGDDVRRGRARHLKAGEARRLRRRSPWTRSPAAPSRPLREQGPRR